jgi:hypothetical protein
MLLELGKAGSFVLSIVSLYPVAISAFFVQGSRLEERVLMALYRVAIAGCVCFGSGLVFTWPSRSNPEAGQPLLSTLPVRMFLWSVTGIAVLFAISWYLTCAGPGGRRLNRDCL